MKFERLHDSSSIEPMYPGTPSHDAKFDTGSLRELMTGNFDCRIVSNLLSLDRMTIISFVMSLFSF